MNKPTVLTILDAFQKVVRPGLDDGCCPSRVDQHFISLQASFLSELEPLIKAHMAEDVSRKIALAELKTAITESLEDMALEFASEERWRAAIGQFFQLVQPWIDRLDK